MQRAKDKDKESRAAVREAKKKQEKEAKLKEQADKFEQRQLTKKQNDKKKQAEKLDQAHTELSFKVRTQKEVLISPAEENPQTKGAISTQSTESMANKRKELTQTQEEDGWQEKAGWSNTSESGEEKRNAQDDLDSVSKPTRENKKRNLQRTSEVEKPEEVLSEEKAENEDPKAQQVSLKTPEMALAGKCSGSFTIDFKRH